MPIGRRLFTEEDQKLLDNLFRKYGKPAYGYAHQYYESITEIYNSMTTGERRTVVQVRTYHYRQKVAEWKENNFSQTSLCEPGKRTTYSKYRHRQTEIAGTGIPLSDIEYRNVRSLSSPGKREKSPPGYVAPLPETNVDNSVAGDEKKLQNPDIGTDYTTKGVPLSKCAPSVDKETNAVTSTRDSSVSTDPLPHHDHGMSTDLVRILAEQAHQLHAMKMKVLKEKLTKVEDNHQMKMKNLQNEIEMKRKQHEIKMEILAAKYKKVAESN